MLLGQIPGADEAIASAASEGWVAVLLVVLVLSICGTFVFVLHQLLREAREREGRFTARQDMLEDFIRKDMLVALRENSNVMQRMLEAAEAICQAADGMADIVSRCRATNAAE